MENRKLRLESLEDRCLLAIVAGAIEMVAEFSAPTEATTWVVNTLDDPTEWDTFDDVVSLREAIDSASIGDTITFEDRLIGGTITLSGTQIEVYYGLTIDATTIGGITIDANGQSRVFYVNGGTLENPVELIGLTITGGTAYGGGGINIREGTLTLTNCTVSENTSSSNYGGGGIYNANNGTLTLTGSTVSGNTSGFGGGIHNCGMLTVIDSVVSENYADNYGGGIYNDGGTLTLLDSTVSGNSAGNGGGIYNNGTLAITNCTVSGNTGRSSGGGIFNSSLLTTIQSVIVGNSTVNSINGGGGIYNSGNGMITALSCTLTGNSAYNGGAINSSSSHPLEIYNTIVALNYAKKEGNDIYSNNDLEGDGNLIGIDPAFNVTPVFESGKLVNLNELDLSLTAKSWAIDRGSNSFVDTETDLAGNPRIFAAWQETATVDIGAYEYQVRIEKDVEEPSLIVTTTLDVIDDTDHLTSLREAILYANVGDTVTFDAALAGATITLAGNEIHIDKPITIDASAIGGITIDANGQSRVFHTTGGSDENPIKFANLIITGGSNASNSGGGIYNRGGTIMVEDCTISGNANEGIYNYDGTVTVTGSTITDNASGGIYTGHTNKNTANLTIVDCLIAGNSGSGINNYGGMTVIGSTFEKNVGYGIYSGYIGNGTVAITDSTLSMNSSGGIYNSDNGGSVTVTGCTVVENSGDGIFNANNGILTVIESTITKNSIYGIRNPMNGNVTITDCTVSENSFYGIYNSSLGTVTVAGSAIVGNKNCGIYNGGGRTTVTGCSVVENSGSGIYNANNGTLIIMNDTISGNSASSGGGIYNNGRNLTIKDTVVSGNSAQLYGGGIYNEEGRSLNISNTVFYGNTAYEGGGIRNDGSAIIINTTISGNSANLGGGIINVGTQTITNSIIALNYANGSNDIYQNGEAFSGNNNLIGSDPGFVVAPNFEAGKLTNLNELDLSLTEKSWAIDRGDNSFVETDTDLAGNPRIYAAWKETATVDIGAYEYQAQVEEPPFIEEPPFVEEPSLIVTTTLDVVDDTDNLISLREAILYANVGGTITFDVALAGATITLAGNEIRIDKPITIDASGIDGIVIDANNKSRVFYVITGTDDTPVELIGLTIKNGRTDAESGGGGICNYHSSVSIRDTIIQGNYTGSIGGGISNDNGKMIITNSTISNNLAYFAGGISNDGGNMTISNSTIFGNSANEVYGGKGGGILNSEFSILTISDTNISGNSATYGGGGIYSEACCSLTITNSTISGNSTKTFGGGGISCSLNNLSIANTIVALNYAKYDNDIYLSGEAFSGSNNLIGFDPGFAVSPYFEADELTNLNELDLSLAEGSCAIDRGDNNFVEADTDIVGNPRIYAAWKENPTVDIGAYEYQARIEKDVEESSLVVTTTLDVVDGTDNLISLREAILYAKTGDTITFDVALAGATITLAGSEIYIDKPITIDASMIGGITIDADGKSRVIYVTTGTDDMSVELIGLTIKNGKTNGNGGGIYNIDSLLTITDTTISNNVAGFGGGVYNENGIINISNSTILSNSAVGLGTGGGGIELWSGMMKVENSIISENYALYHGGGICISEGTLTITNSTISGNSANNDGGGICNFEGELVISNSTIVGNSVANLRGGGIGNFLGSLTVINSTISSNSARSGGGLYNWAETCIIVNSKICENSVKERGGGFYSDGSGNPILTNVTISENSADYGGGICIDYYGDYDCTLMAFNSIISQNAAHEDGTDIYIFGGDIIINAYNTLSSFTDWTESENCPVYDLSQSLFEDAANGDFTLAENSQAIDKGNNSYIAGYDTDLAGNPRIVNRIVDLGAYEYQSNGQTEQLDTPSITTGNRGNYVSYGANRHQVAWDAVENASGYELAYSADGNSWTTMETEDTNAVITGLNYGADMKYSVRALGDNVTYTDSDWSAVKMFNVCPMDINGDGDISGGDRTLLAHSWLAEEGDDNYRYYSDINGDGDVGGADRAYLSSNWLSETGDSDLHYPPAKAADTVFAEYESADIGIDLAVF